nr:integrase, catalytic region, zinc finger, CCHC-type, peptidase aspartic, catalytic [Tanacetum cinerariifolium]
DGENLDKIKEKGDECIFVRYSNQSRAYRVFNKRTRVIIESIHVNFDELPQMASDQHSSDPALECQTMALEHDSLSPGRKCQENVSHRDKTGTMSNELDLLFSLMFDALLNASSKVVSKSSAVSAADAPNERQQLTTPLNNHTTPIPTCQIPSIAPTKVLDLEDELKRTKTAQQTKIDGLERRVKKLEKKQSTHDDVSTQDNIFQDEGIEDVGEEEVVEVVTTAKMIVDVVVDAAQVTTAILDIPVSTAETIVTIAPTITAESTKTNVEVTQAPKRKGVIIQEPEETTIAKITLHNNLRTLVVEGSKKDEVTKGSLKRNVEELEQENAKKQKIKDDKESAELKQCLEIVPDDGDNVIDATPLSSKSPTIVDYKIYKERKKNHFQIFRADDHVEGNVWKNQQELAKVVSWKLFDFCGVYCVTLQSIQFYLLVEKMYPLTHHTLNQMFNNVKLQVDYEREMAYELLRLYLMRRSLEVLQEVSLDDSGRMI